uniref:Uncharacterized protein n=1 Tax=Cacopsylla melanoneura TaxID=428564 RepID=A0A8D8QWT8_9HEMI
MPNNYFCFVPNKSDKPSPNHTPPCVFLVITTSLFTPFLFLLLLLFAPTYSFSFLFCSFLQHISFLLVLLFAPTYFFLQPCCCVCFSSFFYISCLHAVFFF